MIYANKTIILIYIFIYHIYILFIFFYRSFFILHLPYFFYLAVSMKVFLTLFIASLYFNAAIGQLKKLTAEMNLGYLNTNYNWSIAGNGVNILSELHYNPIHALNSEMKLSTNITNRININLSAQILKNISGKGIDADYGGNDRTDPSIGYFNSSKGTGFQVALNSMYLINPKNKIKTSAGLGGVLKKQLFTLNEIDDNQSVTKYHAQWIAASVNTKATTQFQKFEPFIGADLLPFKYYAVADWILRADFKHPKSFEQKSWGFGWKINMGSFYQVNPSVKLKAQYTFSSMKANSGQDIAYLVDRTAYTPFNGSKLLQSSFNLGIEIGIL